MGLAAMLLSLLNVNSGWAIGWAVGPALAIGLLAGLVNGALVILLSIDSLIVTLGTSTFISGVILWVNPLGSIAAVYFLVTGITGLQLLGVQTFVQQLFYGGALVLAVALSQLAGRRDRVAS